MAPRKQKQKEPEPPAQVEEESEYDEEPEEDVAPPPRQVDPRKREAMLKAREKAMEILK